MKKRVTIEDVARASHVSVATVSLVMRGRTGINIETRTRVEQVARALGYQRRISRHEQHAQRISVLMSQQHVTGSGITPPYANMMVGIEDICRRRGILNDLRHLTTHESTTHDNAILFPPQYEYDGVIGVGISVDAHLHKHISERNLPFVLVDIDPLMEMFDDVYVSYQQAITELVSYLASIGHRTIALIDDVPESPVWQHSLRHAIVHYGMVEPLLWTRRSPPNQMHDLVQQLVQQYPNVSAVICRNDLIAYGLIQKLQQMGRSVPQSMSVIGFGDSTNHVAHLPLLTTVKLDAVALGVLAVQTLLHRLEWPNTPLMRTAIHATFVIRQSTQPNTFVEFD